MQLLDLVKPLDQMTEEELFEHIRKMRHNRSVARPAMRKREDRAEARGERKTVKKAKNSLAAALSQLTDAEREALMKQLEGS